jgi:hypothetical protein
MLRSSQEAAKLENVSIVYIRSAADYRSEDKEQKYQTLLVRWPGMKTRYWVVDTETMRIAKPEEVTA